MSGGLIGTYAGSCIVCLLGTDTGLAFRGEAEWIVAGLSVLGVPIDQAGILISEAFGCEQGRVPVGVQTMAVRVCESCAAKARKPMTVGLIVNDAEIPQYIQRVIDA